MSRLLSVCVVVWVSSLIACCCFPGDNAKTSTEPKKVADDASQAERLKVIEWYKRTNVIEKVAGDTVAKLWIKPLFYTLPFEDKKTLAKIVYAWFYKTPNNPKDGDLGLGDHVQILDHLSGKKVGEYSMLGGLSMEK